MQFPREKLTVRSASRCDPPSWKKTELGEETAGSPSLFFGVCTMLPSRGPGTRALAAGYLFNLGNRRG